MAGEISEAFRGRVIVISPHLDDAVLSLGASIAAATRAGISVTVLTVFAGNEASHAEAGPWDAKSGFSTEADAAGQRRLEDRAACAVVGASTRWLPFADEQYLRGGDERTIGSAVAAEVDGADSVLIPGFPLINPDHRWLVDTLLRRGLPCGQVTLYAEQPYLATSGKMPPAGGVPAGQSSTLAPEGWLRHRPPRLDRRAKHAAILCYRSQLRQLGLGGFGLHLLLWRETVRGGELTARLRS